MDYFFSAQKVGLQYSTVSCVTIHIGIIIGFHHLLSYYNTNLRSFWHFTVLKLTWTISNSGHLFYLVPTQSTEIGPQKFTILRRIWNILSIFFSIWGILNLTRNLSYFYTIFALRSPNCRSPLAYKSRPHPWP